MFGLRTCLLRNATKLYFVIFVHKISVALSVHKSTHYTRRLCQLSRRKCTWLGQNKLDRCRRTSDSARPKICLLNGVQCIHGKWTVTTSASRGLILPAETCLQVCALRDGCYTVNVGRCCWLSHSDHRRIHDVSKQWVTQLAIKCVSLLHSISYPALTQ